MSTVEMQAPANPIGPSPARRPQSIRRTSTLDTQWPDGLGQPMRMRGRARDLLTPAGGAAPVTLAEDVMEVLASPTREILTIETCRGHAAAQQLVGARGGGYLRGEIARVLPDEHAQGTPLHLLLDDFSGASLVAGWAWSRWRTDLWNRRIEEARKGGPGSPGRNGSMEGICSGFRPGSSALSGDGGSRQDIQSSARVPPLTRPDDPLGWHELAQQEGVGMRRARRLDVWLEDVIHIDVGFQDSSTAPDGGDRIAIHEYHVAATADPETFEVLSIVSDPRVLPYAECPGASPNVTRLLGRDLRRFRLEVLEQLPGTLGCTHLNDVLRSMADVPLLAGRLREALRRAA
jgi:hypothetical protein